MLEPSVPMAPEAKDTRLRYTRRPSQSAPNSRRPSTNRLRRFESWSCRSPLFGKAIESFEKAAQNVGWVRRVTRDGDVDRNHVSDRTHNSVAAFEHSAGLRAVTNRDHEFG